MAYTSQQASDTLESLVDQFSTSTIIAMLQEIANGKAEHVRSNWQDESLAKQWERLAKVLDRSYLKVNKIDRLLG